MNSNRDDARMHPETGRNVQIASRKPGGQRRARRHPRPQTDRQKETRSAFIILAVCFKLREWTALAVSRSCCCSLSSAICRRQHTGLASLCSDATKQHIDYNTLIRLTKGNETGQHRPLCPFALSACPSVCSNLSLYVCPHLRPPICPSSFLQGTRN